MFQLINCHRCSRILLSSALRTAGPAKKRRGPRSRTSPFFHVASWMTADVFFLLSFCTHVRSPCSTPAKAFFHSKDSPLKGNSKPPQKLKKATHSPPPRFSCYCAFSTSCTLLSCRPHKADTPRLLLYLYL